MNKQIKTLFVLAGFAVVVYVMIAAYPDFDPALFWHDFAANIAAWAVLMMVTVYYFTRRRKA